jgi:GNAT superfamily N-acetyltransferase
VTSSSLRFEVLQAAHDRSTFSSGERTLDHWFRARAGQDQRRNVAQVFVAVRGGRVVGFYSLSMFTLALDSIPAPLARKLPHYDAIPAALIGRLARAESEKGTGVGSLLLADAITRVLSVKASIAAYAIVVDAKDERGVGFYEAHGFLRLPSRPRRLFLLTETAAAALAAARLA